MSVLTFWGWMSYSSFTACLICRLFAWCVVKVGEVWFGVGMVRWGEGMIR